MNWRDKRIPIVTLLIVAAAFLIIAGLLIHRQTSDLELLENTYQNLNTKRIMLQYEQSEKQRELNVASTSDYISARARENGYMMPGEIRFVVRNPEALTQHGTLNQIEVEASPAETAPAEDAAAAESLPEESPAETPVGEEVREATEPEAVAP